MKKLLITILCIAPFAVQAQKPTIQQEFVGMIQYNSQQVISLIQAIPDDKLDWRPAEGVRSVAEAILHTASANYFFGSKLGGTVPEGIDMMTMEKNIKGKENIVAALQKSYDFITATATSITDEALFEEISFPNGQKFNKRMALMIAIGHNTEHKGQLIAYSRANGIVPPWSVKEESTADSDY